MNNKSTLFLKITVIFIGIPVLALCIYGLIWLPNNLSNPNYAYLLYPIIIGMYVSVIPFYIALYQAFKLLNIIDMSQAFSNSSVNALKIIKFCAMTISGVYALIIPFVYLLAEKDDAPGLIIIGTVPVFASIVIAVFSAVLLKLLKNAIDIKDDNDLTI